MAVEIPESSNHMAAPAVHGIFENVENFFDEKFWLGIAPGFTISKARDGYAFKLSPEEKNYNKHRVFIEGYTHLKNPGLKADFPAMADYLIN